MLMDAARRAEAAATEMLACVNDGSASSAEMRQALKASKALMSIVSAFQTNAATVIAMRERHGDGGRHILADAAGLSRRDAHAQVKTARVIEAAPAVREAVESGRVSMANAKRLAEAVDKTSAADVESDSDLLAKAESMRPEDFAREARRWAAAHQDDDGEADYQRLRAKRSVRVWDAEDGMVELHGRFDPLTGRRIGNRLKAEARRLYDADKKNAKKAAKCVSNGSSAGSDNGRSNHADTGDDIGSTAKEFRARRSFDQCMADALDALASNSSNGGGKPFADICVVAHVDDDTGKLIAELPDGVRLPQAVLEEFSCNAKFTGVEYDRHSGVSSGSSTFRSVRIPRGQTGYSLILAVSGDTFQYHKKSDIERHIRLVIPGREIER